jgi:hypothetical protein
MPGADGLEVLGAVRKSQPGALVIVSTGYRLPEPGMEGVPHRLSIYLQPIQTEGESERVLKNPSERIRLMRNG